MSVELSLTLRVFISIVILGIIKTEKTFPMTHMSNMIISKRLPCCNLWSIERAEIFFMTRTYGSCIEKI